MANVLILEDDAELSQSWRAALIENGHSVTLAHEVSAAMDAIRNAVFDIFIVDIFIKHEGRYVPEGGLSLISKLRQLHPEIAEPWWRTAPIIAVSGAARVSGSFDPLRSARDIGANNLMHKPVEIKRLLAAIDELLSGKENA